MNIYLLSQAYYVTLRERSLRPKSLVVCEPEALRCAQGDILSQSKL